ncbi:hypothetical protein L1D33_24315 [Vibrio chagasii]|uniref:hypothetical protein n=1 Tax=Vibrio chagasii TaxID=170679 RepID=UPI001EFD99E4|nr:hypothetical protein [Vibrio chagasii]MCG9676629.1 hypothetical protein [Vibrio chagasii]
MKTYLLSLLVAQFPLPIAAKPFLASMSDDAVVPITRRSLVGWWQCRFTFPLIGDRILDEHLKLDKDGSFSSQGRFEYYLGNQDKPVLFSFSAQGNWAIYQHQLRLEYAPFNIEPMGELSEQYLNDIKKIYLSPSYKGTRRTVFNVEMLRENSMTIGDEHDSWQCVR